MIFIGDLETTSYLFDSSFLSLVVLNNAERNKWLDDLMDRRTSRSVKQKQMFQYMGLELCGVCIASCIGCSPDTVHRARRKKTKGIIFSILI